MISQNQRIRSAQYFIVIFHGIGILGIWFESTHSLFIRLIPFALILNATILFLFHSKKTNWKNNTTFAILFLLGFLAELVGISTDKIFGHYTYGHSLGLKIWNVPLIIGLNWLMLTYVSASILENKSWPTALKINLSALIMVLYDAVLERVAPKMNMWFWKEGQIPLQNYLAWFALAFLFHILIKLVDVKTSNPLSAAILLSQFLFFVILAWHYPHD